jgi:fructokinase
MERHTIVGIGELLWDCFGETRCPGGAPANVAFHAAQLGAHGVVCSRVGCDEAGDALVAYLRARGIEPTTIQRDAEHPTGTVTVNMTQADHPSYVIHEHVAWDYMGFDAVLADVVRTASAVCFGTLAQRTPQTRQTVERCLDTSESAMIVYDVNLRPPWFTREVVEASLRRCHVVKLNEGEASVLSEMFGLSASGLANFATALCDRYNIRTICITRGADGCLAVSGGVRVDVPGRRVDVIDAVGAGDAFTAALVSGLLWRWPLERVARFANEVGALVASRPGAMPQLRKEFPELIARFD